VNIMGILRFIFYEYMQKYQKTITSLIERKTVYQKHRLTGTIVSGLIVLSAVLLLIPQEESVIINSGSIISIGFPSTDKIESYPHSENDFPPPNRPLRITAGKFIPAKKYHLIPEIYDNTQMTALFSATHENNNPPLIFASDNSGSGGQYSFMYKDPGESDPWPLNDTRREISALNAYNLNLSHTDKSPRIGGPSGPIKILFRNSASILPPLETRYIIDSAVFRISLTVNENGTIPKDGIRFISFTPSDLPDRYLSLYRENIQNLLRTEAFIKPAMCFGNEITDSTFLKITYLKGSGGLSASASDNVEIIW